MTLYVDVLFAINFSMDFLSLFITMKILHKKVYKARTLISSTLGGLYGVCEMLIQTSFVISVIVNVAVSVLMCLIAFTEKKIGKLTIEIIVLWGCSATLGGTMSILYVFLNRLMSDYIKNYSYDVVFGGARFFIIAALSVIIALLFSKIFSQKATVMEAEIKILFKNSSYVFKGLCDSGNVLKEPITGRSVILVSASSKIGRAISEEHEMKKRYIPYVGVGSTGMLKGIIPQKILINDSEKSAVVAPIENINFAGYDALIPASLI